MGKEQQNMDRAIYKNELIANLENIESEIELEDSGVDGSYDGPFNPNDIDVDISTVNLGSLLEQLEYNEIDLKPEFQRSSDVWTPIQKSTLIESILLGLVKTKIQTS